MQERFARALRGADRTADRRGAGRPTICTFHSLGVRMLRASGRAVGLKPSFSILDSSDCESLMAQIIGTTDRKLVRATLAQIWPGRMRWSTRTMRHADEQQPLVAAGKGRPRLATAPSAPRQRARFATTRRRSTATSAVDFDDLIRLPLALMRLDDDEAAWWRSRLRYVLIDEYQDTNAAQYELLKELVRVAGRSPPWATTTSRSMGGAARPWTTCAGSATISRG